MNRSAMVIAVVRTAVPAGVGYLLAKLIVAIPVVGVLIGWLDEQIAAAGFADWNVLVILQGAAVGVVCGVYYWLARLLGRRWPVVERFLLGSSKRPVYVTPAKPPKFATRAEARAWRALNP